MEYLLMLQPWASTVSAFCMAVMIGSAVFFFVLLIMKAVYHVEVIERSGPRGGKLDKEDEPHLSALDACRRAAVKVGLIALVVWVLASFIGSSWDMFKNQVVYQVTTSETAEKTVENINLLMDKIKERIEEF